MVSWLIVLCLLVIALCRAAPPSSMVVMAAVSVVAAVSAIGIVTYPAMPTVRVEGDGLREDTGLSEDPDQRDSAQVVGCAGRSGLRACEGWRDAAGLDGCSGWSGGGSGYLTVAHISPN